MGNLRRLRGVAPERPLAVGAEVPAAGTSAAAFRGSAESACITLRKMVATAQQGIGTRWIGQWAAIRRIPPTVLPEREDWFLAGSLSRSRVSHSANR